MGVRNDEIERRHNFLRHFLVIFCKNFNICGMALNSNNKNKNDQRLIGKVEAKRHSPLFVIFFVFIMAEKLCYSKQILPGQLYFTFNGYGMLASKQFILIFTHGKSSLHWTPCTENPCNFAGTLEQSSLVSLCLQPCTSTIIMKRTAQSILLERVEMAKAVSRVVSVSDCR